MSAERRSELEEDIRRGPVNWLALALALVLAAVQFYLGLNPPTEGATPVIPSTLIGVVLVVGAALFFTPYWRPVLYLLWALVGLYVVVVWLFGPTVVGPVTVANAIVAALFAVVCIVALYREQVAYLSDQADAGRHRGP